MLLNLSIRNYVLIDELNLEFGEGLNIFTGETGAGKSIIIETIGLILGEKPAAAVVRGTADRCFLSAEFDVSEYDSIKMFLSDSGLACEEGENLLIRREIDSSGKSRSFVNDKAVSASALTAIGDFLVDLHGQHEHQNLLKTKNQRELIDRYARNSSLLRETAVYYDKWRALSAQQNARRISEEERERLIDLYSFQLKEIDGLKPVPGEEEELERRLPTLKNAEKLRLLSSEICDLLYGRESSALEQTGKAQRVLENIISIAGALSETGQTLKNASSLLDDALRDMEKFRDSLQSDPEVLETLLTRRDQLQKLKKKYGKDIAEILDYREKVSAELEALKNSDRDLKKLEERTKKAENDLLSLCEKLSASRNKAAKKISSETMAELAELGMKKAVLAADVGREESPSRYGIDKIEFMFSANPGTQPGPLKNIASGGEMSRVMLALKSVLAGSDEVPVLIFDEIDAGIGGPMGQTVGEKMKKLSKHHQILCITHLPQIAACAAAHFTVEKSTSRGQTYVSVRRLSKDSRVEEIARMLSGREITPAALKHAGELLEQGLQAL